MTFTLQKNSDQQKGPVTFSLSIPKSSITHFSIPRLNHSADVKFSPMIFSKRLKQDEHVRLEAILPSTSYVKLNFGSHYGAKKAKQKATVTANVHTMISLKEGSLSGYSMINYKIEKGSQNFFRFSLPKGVFLTQSFNKEKFEVIPHHRDKETIYDVYSKI